MIFDDYRISVLDVSEIPPSVEAVGMLTTGTFVVWVLGEPGVTYRLEAATLAAGGISTGSGSIPGWLKAPADTWTFKIPRRRSTPTGSTAR